MTFHKSPLFLAAILAVGLACAFTVSDAGVRWIWADRPAIAAGLVVLAAAYLLALYLQQRKAVRARNRD
ncbi:hypothetical protein [Georgenia deserti]|uniref:Uncharacterized protein n=1 Tax=Georgenia deserti TaxID=2093781 RepID=A0ABW4KY34_9MICO